MVWALNWKGHDRAALDFIHDTPALDVRRRLSTLGAKGSMRGAAALHEGYRAALRPSV
jgi:hypothetical protein